MNVYLKIKETLGAYTKTEKKLANYILSHPKDIPTMSTVELAEASETSTAAVIRFAQRNGFKGFKEFKVGLAASKIKMLDENVDMLIEVGDDFDYEIKQIRQLNETIVEKTFDLIDADQMERIVNKVYNAKTIYVFGVGASALPAADLEQKLARIGRKVLFNKDVHVQILHAQSATPEDVAIVISYSGNTKGTLAVADYLTNKNVPTFAISKVATNPLSKIVDETIGIPSEEKALRVGAIFSRISSFIVTDILYYGIYKKDIEDNSHKIRMTKNFVDTLLEDE